MPDHDHKYEETVAVLVQRSNETDRRLGRIDHNIEKIFDQLNKMSPMVARLEVKAGIWGGVGGLLAALVMIGVALVKL